MSKDNTAPSGLAEWHRLGDKLPDICRPLLTARKDDRGFWRVYDGMLYIRYEEVTPALDDLKSERPPVTWWFDSIYPGKGNMRLGTPELLWRYIPSPDDATTPPAHTTCQKCGGKIEGWTCQGCGQEFSEHPDGHLVFCSTTPPVARPDREALEPIAWKLLEEIPAINDLGSQYQEDITAALLKALSLYPAEGKGGVSEAQPSPLPANEAWIPWTGGECPVPGQMVDVRYSARPRRAVRVFADTQDWTHYDGQPSSNIIAYRIAQPEGGEG